MANKGDSMKESDLKLIKKECKSRNGCEGCDFYNPIDGFGINKNGKFYCILQRTPAAWDFRKINPIIEQLRLKYYVKSLEKK